MDIMPMREYKNTKAPNWSELTPEQKREERLKKWLAAPGVKFNGPEAEKLYRERVTRFIKAVKLEEGDRVPCMLPVGYFPAYYAGYDLKTVMYDYEKQRDAWRKFMNDFGDMDTFGGPTLVLPAPALEMIDHKIHKWPGHGIANDVASYQYVESEYMKANAYDKLILDPSDFWLRTFMPRQAGAFKPLAKLPHLTAFVGIPFSIWVSSLIRRYSRLIRPCSRQVKRLPNGSRPSAW